VKILHLTQTDIRADSRILKEMQSLLNSDNNYRLFGIGVIQRGGEPSVSTSENLNIRSIGIYFRDVRYLPKMLVHSLLVVEILIKMSVFALKIKPTVIHCHDTPVLPLGVFVKLLTGARLIYDAHELESNKNGLSKTLGKLTLFVEKLLWRFIDRLIVVSPSIQKWYANNVGKKKSEVILNSPLLKKQENNYNSLYLREKFSIPDESKIFLYIGIFEEGRGIGLITEAFKNNKLKSHLVFLGYGVMKEKLLALSKENNNIHIHDAVPHEEVVPIAKSADVGLAMIENVSLSDYYCLPNKLFEYIFSQIPILASNFPDILNVVEKYNLGKCSNLDSKSICSAIKEFEEMKILPKIDLKEMYGLSWNAQEEKLNKLYKEIL
jgi:glycosyltransferase involved in cell wall biosynthesis